MNAYADDMRAMLSALFAGREPDPITNVPDLTTQQIADLVEWVYARLDEELSRAGNATDAPWVGYPAANGRRGIRSVEFINLDDHGKVVEVAEVFHEADAAFIAVWNPDRALRELAAKGDLLRQLVLPAMVDRRWDHAYDTLRMIMWSMADPNPESEDGDRLGHSHSYLGQWVDLDDDD